MTSPLCVRLLWYPLRLISGCLGGLGDLINQSVFHGDRREEFPTATLEMRAPSHHEGSVRLILFAKDGRFGILQGLTDGGLEVFLGLIVHKHSHGSVSSWFGLDWYSILGTVRLAVLDARRISAILDVACLNNHIPITVWACIESRLDEVLEVILADIQPLKIVVVRRGIIMDSGMRIAINVVSLSIFYRFHME